jgi:hypothetical protein
MPRAKRGERKMVVGYWGNVVMISDPYILKPIGMGFFENNVKNPGKSS